MHNGKLLVFEINAPFGFLKIGEVTRATISYPFSRTSILGIIGAILGKPRNSYWNTQDSLNSALIGLEILNPIKHLGLMVNYGHSKNTINVGGNRGVNTFQSTQSGQTFDGFMTNVRLDLIRDVSYRVFFYSQDSELYSSLKKHLEESEFEFPPYLGHANMLVDIKYICETNFTSSNANPVELESVCSTNIVAAEFISASSAIYSIVTGIPIKMGVEGNLIVKTYHQNFIIPSEIGKSIYIKKKSNIDHYIVEYPKCGELEIKGWKKAVPKNIIFMPV